jgi:hypothetical protein
MPRQTEIFDEMDRLRDEVRKLEDAGERLANALTGEQEKNSRLEAEIAGSGKTGEWGFLSDFNPEYTLLYSVGCAFVAFVTAGPNLSTISDESVYILMSLSRFLAQVLFFAWCVMIYNRDGLGSLSKKLCLWAAGWAGALWICASYHQGMPMLEFRLIDASFPANWWMPPFAVRGPEFIGCIMLLIGIADITTHCTITKWCFSKAVTVSEKLRGWTA